jgi:predicted nucleotidyltransferase component of viral defense system
MTPINDGPLPYRTADAFNKAISAHIISAERRSSYANVELRRQFVYDRLLQRVFAREPNDWVLKGGGGMLARIPGVARHSMDLDMLYKGDLRAAITRLRDLAARDGGDFFEFRFVEGRGIGDRGVKLGVIAILDDQAFERFNVDLVIVSNMTQEPDLVQSISPLTITGLSNHPYRVYPVVDHLADKHAAIIERTARAGEPSSRYRDLIDITIMARTQHVDASALRTALFSEYAHRGLAAPSHFEVPSPAWRQGYEDLVSLYPNTNAPTNFDDALAIASALFDPVLNGTASGRWNPDVLGWELRTPMMPPVGC